MVSPRCSHAGPLGSSVMVLYRYPIQKVTEIYNTVTELYNKVTELENSSWNVLCLLRSKVAYIRTGHILP
jgi:hypothetical protein